MNPGAINTDWISVDHYVEDGQRTNSIKQHFIDVPLVELFSTEQA